MDGAASGVRSIVVHGHFYQPPRENPWTGAVDPEPTAAPSHDWNERITSECYRPLARVPVGRLQDSDPVRLNAYQFLSFDFGPTLLEWLDAHAPDVVETVVRADRESRSRLGRGNAMAMPYHHVILPLSGRRDKVTEVRWGMADFRRRFGREPDGMWLPETAVDGETLDVLAAEGIAFTVVAPHQLASPSSDGRAVRVRTPGGRTIAVFAYDGELSHGVAFGGLVKDSAEWRRLVLSDRGRAVVGAAVDGETFGHHHRFADLALGALLRGLAARREVRVENFASALARHPPEEEAKLVEPTSWSCAHGVERWRSDCGCRMARDTRQQWRAPLRAAIGWLVGEVHSMHEREAAALGLDPWALRDAADPASPPPAGGGSGRPDPRSPEPQLARSLDMERNALRALTSCGWFFDDFAGLEGRQVLRYAARAIELSGPQAPLLEAGFLERLAPAISNDPGIGSAGDYYRKLVREGGGRG